MAEADYGFKPGPAAELRTFGQLFAYVASSQFGSCSAALGQPNPNQGHNLEIERKTKAEFQKALADSFTLCDRAFAALTEQNAMQMVKQGQGEIARAALLANVRPSHVISLESQAPRPPRFPPERAPTPPVPPAVPGLTRGVRPCGPRAPATPASR